MAQTAANHLSVDLDAGMGGGLSGGDEIGRGGFATGIVAAWRTATHARASGIVGFDAFSQWQPGGDAICVTGRNGSCMPHYPDFNAVSAVVGGEWAIGRRGAARLLCGPGDFAGTKQGRRAHAFGVLSRLDVSISLIPHTAFAVGFRYGAVPNFHSQFFAPSAINFGLRLE